MRNSKSKILIPILILGLLLTPAVVNAQPPEPTPSPWPEEWLIEYAEWADSQQKLQQQYTNETGRGLGVRLDFIDWALMREAYGAYWWQSTWVAYSYAFCDSNGNRESRRSEGWVRQ